MSEIFDGSSGHRLELDLSALRLCDLSGLRALHVLDRAGTEARREVRVTAAAPCLDVLLNLCQTSTLLGYSPPPARLDGE